MKGNFTQIWFNWFYKNWAEYKPGDLLDKGLKTAKIAERFVSENEEELFNLAQKFDDKNYEALNQFMRLSESELYVIKYFLKLVKIKNFK